MSEQNMRNAKLRTSVLQVCDSYQRLVNKAQVNRIVREYDPDAFGSLTVGKRPDGTYWVVDGYQRLSAARQMGIESVHCDVFESDGQAHEARVFRIKNAQRRGVTSLIVFRARLTEREEQAQRIRGIAHGYGLNIATTDKSSGWPYIKATATLDYAFEKIGENGLDRVLRIITEAYRGESKALHTDFLYGVTRIIQNHPDLDDERLIRRLTVIPVASIFRSAKANQQLLKDSLSTNHGDRHGRALYLTLVHVYNQRLKEDKKLKISS